MSFDMSASFGLSVAAPFMLIAFWRPFAIVDAMVWFIQSMGIE